MLGRLLCFLGFHIWRPINGTTHLEYRGKWDVKELASGICVRCLRRESISRNYYW